MRDCRLARCSTTTEEPVDLRQPKLDLLCSIISDRPVEESQEKIADVGLTPRIVQGVQTDLHEVLTRRLIARAGNGRHGKEGEIECSVAGSGEVQVDHRSEFAM